MKIYTDINFKIIAIDEEPTSFEFVYELEKSPFPPSWTTEKILTYCYQVINGEEKIYPR